MRIRYFLISILVSVVCTSFGYEDAPPDNCNPNAKAFDGYTFIHPGIIHTKAAYAPYLVEFGDYYNRYFEQDIAKRENLKEWQSRFCYQAPLSDIERVVYQSTRSDLNLIYNAIEAKAKTAPAPFSNNLFAQQLVEARCSEVPLYLMFSNSCEVHTQSSNTKWKGAKRDSMAMANLILEGLDLFKHTESHFLRMRIAYQVVRLAHYNKNYPQVVELYNYLLPKINRRKSSIIYFWTLGHLAGALQKMGKNAEAAYRFMLVFRSDPGKRATAHRSFYLKNDAEWQQTLKLCQNDGEKASLYILRAAGSKVKNVQDLRAIYELDPTNPQLGLLLVSAMQSLERVLLTNYYTELVHNKKPNTQARDKAASELIKLQAFIQDVIKENKAENIKLWKCMDAYASLLRFDDYEAEQALRFCRRILDNKDEYDKELIAQLDIWDHLLSIHKLNPSDAYAEDAAFRIRSFAIHHTLPAFEPYLKERMAIGYAKNKETGKAILTAFDKKALLYHPKLADLDGLIAQLQSDTMSAIETDMSTDKYMQSDVDYYIEAKGMALLAMNKPEAAIMAMEQMSPTYLAKTKVFTPFKERIGEKVHTVVADSVNVNRLELAKKILQYQFAAKAAFDQPNKEAKYYYLLGLCYYNCSYFGYSWEAFDAFRSGSNWTRLAKGPVFGAAGTPYGNYEHLELNMALSYFVQTIHTAKDPELKAKATFFAAKCQQKQWFTDETCTYKSGNKEIPVLPDAYRMYQDAFLKNDTQTGFYKDVIAECKWFDAYARRGSK